MRTFSSLVAPNAAIETVLYAISNRKVVALAGFLFQYINKWAVHWYTTKFKITVRTDPCLLPHLPFFLNPKAYTDLPVAKVDMEQCKYHYWNVTELKKWTRMPMSVFKVEQLERLCSEDTPPPPPPPPPHDYPYYWVILDPESKEDKVKVTNLKNLPIFQIFLFLNKRYMRHTFWSCLIRCANMKWIRQVLLKLQSRHYFPLPDGQTDDVKPVYPLWVWIWAPVSNCERNWPFVCVTQFKKN